MAGCLPRHFDWKRFWVPSGERVRLDGGYLADPDSEFGHLFNPKAVPLSELAGHQCLVLLGEPGMGKTTAMEDGRAGIRQGVTSAGEALLWPNLRICGGDTALDKYLFDTEEFQSWVTGGRVLNLFLDGLDECVARIEVFVPLLLAKLGSGDPARLRLRIACRTSEWPRSLHDGLAKVYDKQLRLYEIAPLCKKDVVSAAGSLGLDVERFLDELRQYEAVPFAIKPVTLNMLLTMFQRSQHLPSDLADLYRKGCEILCEECDTARIERSNTPGLSARQRVHLARRIAATMAFCQRTSIVRKAVPNIPEETDLTFDEILGDARRDKADHPHPPSIPQPPSHTMDAARPWPGR